MDTPDVPYVIGPADSTSSPPRTAFTLRRQRLVQYVADRLEAAVLGGGFKVGEKLPSEEKLAESLGVGRRAVREALKVLETRGLVEVRMGVGTVVTRNDLDSFLGALTKNVRSYLSANRAEALHVAELRLLLEGAPMERLLGGDASTVKDLRQLLDHQREAIEQQDSSAYQQWHFRFHEAIVDSLDNPVVSMIYRNVMAVMRPSMEEAGARPKVAAEALADHERILTAIESSSRESVEDALRIHLSHFYTAMREREQDGSHDQVEASGSATTAAPESGAGSKGL